MLPPSPPSSPKTEPTAHPSAHPTAHRLFKRPHPVLHKKARPAAGKPVKKPPDSEKYAVRDRSERARHRTPVLDRIIVGRGGRNGLLRGLNVKALRIRRKKAREIQVGRKIFPSLDIGDALVPVLWIRIGFNADPDSAFYLSADLDTDPDLDPGSQINADPGGSGSGSGQTNKQKVEFYI